MCTTHLEDRTWGGTGLQPQGGAIHLSPCHERGVVNPRGRGRGVHKAIAIHTGGGCSDDLSAVWSNLAHVGLGLVAGSLMQELGLSAYIEGSHLESCVLMTDLPRFVLLFFNQLLLTQLHTW